jgi:hypothetical protein
MIGARVIGTASSQEWGRAITFSHEIRWAKHPRLIGAHEQRSSAPRPAGLATACAAIRQVRCLRGYVEGCGEAAGCATVSFERL